MLLRWIVVAIARVGSPALLQSVIATEVARVYLAKHRVAAMLKQEVRRLEKAAEHALRMPG